MTEKKRISIDIAADLHKRLQIEAVMQDTTIKLLIEEIVEKEAKKTIARNVGSYSNSTKTK